MSAHNESQGETMFKYYSAIRVHQVVLSSSAAAVLMHGSLPVPEFSCFQYGYHWTWTVVAAPAAAAAAAHI